MDETYSTLIFHGREVPKSFEPLIFSRWLRSLRHGNDFYKLMEAKAYYAAYHRYIENTLARPETVARFAVLTSDPDIVLGFSIMREMSGQLKPWVVNEYVLEYVHVHKDFRRAGIAKHLTPGAESFTHLTNLGHQIWAKDNYKHLTFNPFA